MGTVCAVTKSWTRLSDWAPSHELHSLLRPNNNPLYDYTKFYLHIWPLIDLWVVSVLEFHKECCHEHLCASTYVDTNFHLSWSRIAESNSNSWLIFFLWNCQAVFQSVCPIYIFKSIVWRFWFLHILDDTGYRSTIDGSHLYVMSHCGFDFYFFVN